MDARRRNDKCEIGRQFSFNGKNSKNDVGRSLGVDEG